jgi:predicted TIM-barrel fold metal-dependent hydrolase
VPAFFADEASKAGYGSSVSRGFPRWSPEAALEFMDANAIAKSYLSISQPGVHFGDGAMAAALARRCNDDFATLAAAHPARFGTFATLPLPDVDAACEEVVRTLDELKFDGVALLASYGGGYLGDPEFDSILALLDAREAVVFVHPNYAPSSRNLGMGIPGFLVEFPFDTTRAVANLIFRGALERYPRIRFILAHNGGAVPYLAWRLAMAPLIEPQLGHLTPAGVLEALRGFYYECAQAAGPAVMAALAQITDPDHLLFGTDWPYCPAAVAAAGDQSLEARHARGLVDLEAIHHGNAERLFGD